MTSLTCSRWWPSGPSSQKADTGVSTGRRPGLLSASTLFRPGGKNVNRRIAVMLLALAARIAGACSNPSDDRSGESGGGTAVPPGNGGGVTSAEVQDLPIAENVPVTGP